MTKVRRTAGAAVLPLVAAAVGIGVGATPVDAAICSPLSSASVTGPSGAVTAGSNVHASARVSGMLLTAHMQITGPGLDQQVGPSAISGVIEGDVRVPEPGVFTLKVVGSGTGCVYDSDSFSVKERPSASEPTPHGTASGATGTPPGATHASRPPKKHRGAGTKAVKLPTSSMPFRPPGVVPDGTGPSVRLPSADPQVAAPPVRQPQPRADNAAETLPPIKWGQSIAIAAVLLLLSAHMGMWSRRQRLAAAGARRGRGTRRANQNPQVTARMSVAGDWSVPDRDRLAEPDHGRTPLVSGVAYTGVQQQRGHAQGQPFSSRPPGATHPVDYSGMVGRENMVGQENWADPRGHGGATASVGRATRSGRSGYRGRRRRS